MRKSQKILAAFAIVALASALGCGGAKVKTEMVTGKVTLDGQPVAKATVTFAPASGGSGAYGTTDDNGVYTLTTQGGAAGKGALPGEYQVAVIKEENVAPQPTPEERQKASAEGRDISKDYPAEFKSIVPKKYNAPQASGLTATVVKGKNTIDFDLKSE